MIHWARRALRKEMSKVGALIDAEKEIDELLEEIEDLKRRSSWKNYVEVREQLDEAHDEIRSLRKELAHWESGGE